MKKTWKKIDAKSESETLSSKDDDPTYRSNDHQPVVNTKRLYHDTSNICSQNHRNKRGRQKGDVDGHELRPSILNLGRHDGPETVGLRETAPELPEQFRATWRPGGILCKTQLLQTSVPDNPRPSGNMSCIVIHFRQWAQCSRCYGTAEWETQEMHAIFFHVGTWQRDRVFRRKRTTKAEARNR